MSVRKTGLDFPYFFSGANHGCDTSRVEFRIGQPFQFHEGLLVVPGILVRAFGGQRVEYVGDRDDACLQRNVVAGQAVEEMGLLGFEAERKGLTRDQVVSDLLKSRSL